MFRSVTSTPEALSLRAAVGMISRPNQLHISDMAAAEEA